MDAHLRAIVEKLFFQLVESRVEYAVSGIDDEEYHEARDRFLRLLEEAPSRGHVAYVLALEEALNERLVFETHTAYRCGFEDARRLFSLQLHGEDTQSAGEL